VDFEEARQEYLRLKAAFTAGEINAAQFEEAVYGLVLLDDENRLWQIGVSSGAWYRKEGEAWIEDSPPAHAAALIPSASPEMTPQPKSSVATVLNLPVWAWTLFSLGGLVTLLGAFTLLTFYFINQRPTPIAVARTLVVYGTQTPTQRTTPTRTAVVGTIGTPEASETPVPTDDIDEILPTITITSAPTPLPQPNSNQLPAITWKLLSRSDFDRMENLSGEWRGIIESIPENESGQFEFVNYKGLNGLRLKYVDEFVDVFMETDEDDLVLSDVEIDEVIAFRAGDTSGYVDIMCRFDYWSFTYTFSINTENWSLLKFDDAEEVTLASGQLPSGFRSGDWGRVRMRCVGDTISVWLNSSLLASVRDTTFPTGQWAISLYRNEDFQEAELYLNSHRVYQQRDEAALFGDMVQSGDSFVTLDGAWRREGSRYSLGVWIENRSKEALNIESNQIYLLRPDGSKIAVDANPSEGNAFRFPFSLSESLLATNLYFSQLTADDIDQGLQLVIDLSSSGLSVIRFQLPVN
jgi:hypothetical protein